MKLPMDLAFWAAALVPILFLLIAIMKLGWNASKAAPVGMLLAFFIAVAGYRSSPVALAWETGKGIWNAATILLVIWPAVYLYELIGESKAFGAIKSGIQSVTKHELLQILIFGWVFPCFLQGITGFGVAVAVGAPLLLSIGVTPFYSIVIVLLCHSWGTTFGTLALAWNALVQQSGLTGEQQFYAALLTAVMLWIFNIICVLYSCWLYGKAQAIKEIWPVVLVLSLLMGGGQVVLAPLNAQVSFFIPAAAALLVVFALSRTSRYSRVWRMDNTRIINERKAESNEQAVMSFHEAFLPYYALTLITVVCLLIPPVNKLLSAWKWGLAFPATVTGYGYVTGAEKLFSPLAPLTYAGTFLILSAVLSVLYYTKQGYIRRTMLARVWHRTVTKCIPSTLAITSLIVMAKFMGSSGQIYVLSKGIIDLLGEYYVLTAPVLGMIGAFITSSNMSSNILFGNFQSTAAAFLHINPAVTCALQTTGGVLGDSFSPGCIIMGKATTGFQGEEGRILRTIMPVALSCGIVFGIFALVFLI